MKFIPFHKHYNTESEVLPMEGFVLLGFRTQSGGVQALLTVLTDHNKHLTYVGFLWLPWLFRFKEQYNDPD